MQQLSQQDMMAFTKDLTAQRYQTGHLLMYSANKPTKALAFWRLQIRNQSEKVIL